MICTIFVGVFAAGLLWTSSAQAQPPMGGPGSSDADLVERFDADKDGILNTDERKQAREYWEAKVAERPQRRRFGRGGQREPGKPGQSISPADVENYPDQTLYDSSIVRTLFLEFESDDWEKELELFKPTDVEVPATLTVDGKAYAGVGVSFRGASSFFMIPPGLKRSLNLSIDFSDGDQRLYGYKSMNLLNGNGDASLMSSYLYADISGRRIPTPDVNFVRVVINGENWGLYVSSQQFNTVFVKQHFASDEKQKGARWKVSGSPRGDGGLRYLGEDIEPYRDRFEIKSKDTEASWRALINLCKVLNETPEAELEEALEPILELDTVLWFLAVDVALANSDGYWTRASDYSIYLNPDGKFHILPHDMNEAFKMGRGRRSGPPGGGPGAAPAGPGRPGGPGAGPPRERGGPPKARPQDAQKQRAGNRNRGGGFGGGGGPTLDPLVGLDEDRKPLRSRLLNVPSLQRRYLLFMREIATMLQWENLGPHVSSARKLIVDDVRKDTRKLATLEAFLNATSNESSGGLHTFAEQRSTFLLNHEKIRDLPRN